MLWGSSRVLSPDPLTTEELKTFLVPKCVTLRSSQSGFLTKICISNIREYMFHAFKISVLSCFKAPNSSFVTGMF